MDNEQFALKLSVWAAVFFAALGIGFGVLTRSDAIMLDGPNRELERNGNSLSYLTFGLGFAGK